MEVLFHLRYPKRDKSKATVYCRCTVDSVRGPEKSLNIRINRSDWNIAKQCITANSEAAQLQNARVNQIRQDFDRAYLELRKQETSITARKLIEAVFGNEKSVFRLSGLYKKFIERKKATTLNCEATYGGYDKRYNCIVKKIGDVLVADITDDCFIKMILALKKDYSNDYAVKIGQLLRSLLDYAESKKIIDKNPTKDFRLERKDDYDTTHLDREELARLIAHDFEGKRLLSEERDAFVFCAFTGLHHADYSLRTYKLIQHNNRTWLCGFRKKSVSGKKDKTYEMPLHPVALEIINRYGGVENLPTRNNTKRNLLLKTIAAHVGIEINLCTKIARKTFADYCLNNLSMRLETLAELLGHTSLDYVKHYAKITNVSIDKEMIFE